MVFLTETICEGVSQFRNFFAAYIFNRSVMTSTAIIAVKNNRPSEIDQPLGATSPVAVPIQNRRVPGFTMLIMNPFPHWLQKSRRSIWSRGVALA